MAEKNDRTILKERDLYEPVKAKLEVLIGKTHNEFSLEVTAGRKFSNILKAEISPHGYRDIIFHFLREAAPDITGFIKEQYSSAFVVVEVKNDELKLDDIYQAKRYAELFDAKYPLSHMYRGDTDGNKKAIESSAQAFIRWVRVRKNHSCALRS